MSWLSYGTKQRTSKSVVLLPLGVLSRYPSTSRIHEKNNVFHMKIISAIVKSPFWDGSLLRFV